MVIESTSLAYAQRHLLEPYQLDQQALAGVFAEILTRQVDYADLYFQYRCSEQWSLEEGLVKTGQFGIENGVGVRAISGEKTAFAYSDDISLTALTQAARATRAIARQGSRAVAALTHPLTQPRLYSDSDPLLSLEASAKIALLHQLESYARREDPRVSQVMATLSADYEVILVARHDGYCAADIRPLVRLGLVVVVEHNGIRESAQVGGGGRFDYHYFSQDVLQHYAQQAVRQALVNLQAKPAPAGEMTVVLGSGWPGILLHEAIGHGLEADFNRKASSAFAGRIGQRVAADSVSVIDDGSIPQRRGSLNIDDEGTPTQRTLLIERGVLTGYLQDSMNARLMNMPLTGNARRESYAHMVMPRMTNTIMLAGDKKPEEIIASVKRGLYAVNFSGGQVDITNGKFVFSTSEAYMIENGKISFPVKGAMLIGNGPDVLTKVTLVGDDLTLDPGVGTCGKEGQSVPVGVGQPTMRIDGGLTVGGTQS